MLNFFLTFLMELLIHSLSRTTLEVTETGAKGAAATAATMDRMDSSFGQRFFEVDHPFLFLAWDYYSGVVLLMGRVVQPEPLWQPAAHE